jgi:hypothetical protein
MTTFSITNGNAISSSVDADALKAQFLCPMANADILISPILCA